MSENTAVSDVILESRKKVTLTGISDVESFDEQEILASSECGDVTIHGSELKICKLSVETGDMTVEGRIDSISYDDAKKKSGIFSRMLG